MSAVRSRKMSAGVTLAGVDHNGDLVVPEFPLQWWPESLSDSMAIGWNEKNIPGASHAVMQWGTNSGRTIAFSIKLTRSMRYLEDFTNISPFGGGVPVTAALVNPDEPRSIAFNTDIRLVVRQLRALCYPDYDSESGQALPPVITILNVPGLALNEGGGDAIYTVVTGCDVTYTKTFPDGKPRKAEVNLVFKQIVQTKDGVKWKSRKVLLEDPLGVTGGGNYIPSGRDLAGLDPEAIEP